MKVCSIYGAGFFYIPGTDSCIKIGGWVRAEYAFQSGNSDVPFVIGGDGRNNRIDTRDSAFRARWVTSVDIRTQTEYGTLRAYSRAGFQTTTGETTQGRIYTERGFIQFAGFTFGKSQSYFDFFGGAFCYGCGYLSNSSQTGAAGTLLAAYTATFGNGFTATLSIEDGSMRRGGVWDAGTDALAIGAYPGPSTLADSYNFSPISTGDSGANSVPDIVGSLRVDQAWGSAQIAGALHQVRAGYYGNNLTTPLSATSFAGPGGWTGLAPSDKWGWAAMGGLVLNIPWNKGDKIWVEGTVGEGTLGYAGQSSVVGTTNTFQRFNGGNVAAAWALDAVFANVIGPAAASGGAVGGSGLQLTRFWEIAGAIEHYWTPALRTDLFASYTAVDFNDTATAIFCASPVGPVRTAAGATPSFATGPVIGCNPDYNLFNVGARTIWNPAPQFDIGLEVMYSRVETKFDPATVLLSFAGSGGRAGGNYVPSSENVWSSILRFQRNFWP